MSTPSVEERVATELVGARREGRSLAGFPGRVPADMGEAYRIQEAAMTRWPDSLAGWKIGYIAADRRAVGAPDRLIGPIWRRQCHEGRSPTPPVEAGIFAAGFAAVEAELVIRAQQDLPDHNGADWTADEAAELDQQLLFGIEVASSPIPDINALGPTVIAADFGNNNGLVLGAVVDRPASDPVELDCRVDGQLMGSGSAENLPGGIHHGLATALNLLVHRGRTVRTGMLFATGAITGIHPVGPGQHCRVHVQGGPAVELRTVDARTLLVG